MSEWIEVVGWDRFQHYSTRDPIWIKNYVALLSDPDYLALPPGTRAVLHGLWLAYASSRARLALDTRSLASRLQMRVTRAQLDRLNDAGFIVFRASKPASNVLAQNRTEQKELLDRRIGENPRARDDASGAALETLLTTLNGRPSADDLVAISDALRGADTRTVNVLRALKKRGLPTAAFAAAWESLEQRRAERPPLISEARYFVAALKSMLQEGAYGT